MPFLGCKPPGYGHLHRTLNGLSQTRPLQQHTGLSRTVRRYPAAGANGQLTSNALPSGPGLELRDGTQPASHVNHLSPPWGKVASGLRRAERHPTHPCPASASPSTPSRDRAVTLSFTVSASQQTIGALALCKFQSVRLIHLNPGTLTAVCGLLLCHLWSAFASSMSSWGLNPLTHALPHYPFCKLQPWTSAASYCF